MSGSKGRRRGWHPVARPLIENVDRRAGAHRIEAQVGLAIGRMVNVDVSVKDRAGRVAPSVTYLIWTMAVIIVPIACLIVCRAAGAGTPVILWSCLGSFAVSAIIAAMMFTATRPAGPVRRHGGVTRAMEKRRRGGGRNHRMAGAGRDRGGAGGQSRATR